MPSTKKYVCGEISILDCLYLVFQFEYRGSVYRAFRGIPQGNHASTRLCDLYLGAADCERYFELMKRRDTLLIRYVDDYLLLTTDINVAQKARNYFSYVGLQLVESRLTKNVVSCNE